jgi:plastocyanin
VGRGLDAPVSESPGGLHGANRRPGLRVHGKRVTKLKAGTPYRFVIRDRAAIHDFHLTGPGLDRVLTSVPFTGTKSFVLRLGKGSYRFVCDPHSGIMHGRFNVS